MMPLTTTQRLTARNECIVIAARADCTENIATRNDSLFNTKSRGNVGGDEMERVLWEPECRMMRI